MVDEKVDRSKIIKFPIKETNSPEIFKDMVRRFFEKPENLKVVKDIVSESIQNARLSIEEEFNPQTIHTKGAGFLVWGTMVRKSRLREPIPKLTVDSVVEILLFFYNNSK